jgi:hypothetical protein
MSHDESKGKPSRSAYVKGCHCPECRSENTRYKAEWRSRPRRERPGVFESRAVPLDTPANYDGEVWD